MLEVMTAVSSACDAWMPYRLLCNDDQREGVKSSPDLAFGLFCYVPLHKIRDGF